MAKENLLRGQIKGTLEKEQNRSEAAEKGGGRAADRRLRNKILDSGKVRGGLQGERERWKELFASAALLGTVGLGTPKGTPKQVTAFRWGGLPPPPRAPAVGGEALGKRARRSREASRASAGSWRGQA